MNQNPRTAAICWLILPALVAAGLVGCASESTPRLAPPPAPFVPTSVVVTLGSKGGATTLLSTQSGGWTRNGQPFTSGSTVRGQNAATYRLTLSGSSWSAEFVPPDPARVRLGTSGDDVNLQVQEDGTFQLASTTVDSGHVVTARNGNRYTLTQDVSGRWSAAFLVPDPLRLALGTSGDSVNIEIRENRTFWLGGAELHSGHIARATNGNRYALALGTDGMWRAIFVQPDPQRVALGSSGRSVLVSRLENGSYQLEGSRLLTGGVRETAGAMYRFSLGADGGWTATFFADPAIVRLGSHGGTVRVVLQENGAWLLGNRTIRSGDIVRGSNGHNYRLTLVGGAWRADPQPMSVQVPLRGTGGSIFLTRVEDGSYLYEGMSVSSGDAVSVGNRRYRLVQLASGSWWAALMTAPTVSPVRPEPGEPPVVDSLAAYVGVSPRVRLTEYGSSTSRQGSILQLNDLEYSVNALFTYGSDVREITFAQEAHARITDELEQIEVLIRLVETTSGLRREIERRWDRVADHLNTIFPGDGGWLLGFDAPKRRDGSIDYEEVIEDIEAVLEALSFRSDFRDALDHGIFSASRRVDPDDIDDTFFAVRTSSHLGFGWTASTRYGAYSKQERSALSRALEFASGSEGIGAFAYSPLETTPTSDLPASGEGYYFGETVAASRESSQAIYTGNIEMRVRFASRQVTALVTDLEDADGRPWSYSLQEVDRIHLPAARLHSGDGSFETTSGRTASISFSPSSTGLSSTSLSADFEGRFVGRGVDAGESAIGTWNLASRGNAILAGGFGVDSESRPRRPATVVRPARPASDLGEEAETWLGTRPDSNGDIRIAARDSTNRRIELPAAELASNGGAVAVGERLFDNAQKALQDNLALLGIYIDIFDSRSSHALPDRQALWDAANKTLRDNIFGTLSTSALGRTYPLSGSSLSRRDDKAVELLQEAYQALGSASGFRDAVEEGGIFDNILSRSKLDEGDYDFSHIYAALDYQVDVGYDNTDYARFGAWAKRVRANALSPVTVATGSERADVFAYSPIGQTVYSRNDANFPRGFSSTYVGRTVAVGSDADGAALYDGDISLVVRWRSSIGTPAGSSVTTVIENLARTDTGEPVLHEGLDVSHIILGGAVVRLDEDSRIGFQGRSSVRVRYFDPGLRESSSGFGRTEGKFVGYHPSGPLGVIGTWEWEGLEGAFGADIAP